MGEGEIAMRECFRLNFLARIDNVHLGRATIGDRFVVDHVVVLIGYVPSTLVSQRGPPHPLRQWQRPVFGSQPAPCLHAQR